MKVSIGKAAREIGVSRSTLRRLEAEGKITADRAPNGRRMYDLMNLRRLALKPDASARVTLAYARVPRPEQQDRLEQQTALLESFCSINGWAFQVVKDVGSGADFRSRELNELIARVRAGEVGRLVITTLDRLPRIGAELVLSLCERFGTEVVILNAAAAEDSDEE